MAVYNRSSEVIQVASQPERVQMKTRVGFVIGWCLSHLPGTGCFISHYCANAHSKQVMMQLYGGEHGYRLMHAAAAAAAPAAVSAIDANLPHDGNGNTGVSSSGGDSSGGRDGELNFEVHYLNFS